MFGFVDVSNLHVRQRCEHAFAKYGIFFSKLCCSNLFGQLKFCSAALLSSTLLSTSDARPPVPPGYVVRLPAPQPHQETPRWPSDGRSGLRKWGRGVTTRWSPKGWTPHDFCWSNMVCWKIPYLWMIFSLRPSCVISRTAMFDCWKVYIFHHKLLLFGVTCV